MLKWPVVKEIDIKETMPCIICFRVPSLPVTTYEHSVMACLLIRLNQNYTKIHSSINWYLMIVIDCFLVYLVCIVFHFVCFY